MSKTYHSFMVYNCTLNNIYFNRSFSLAHISPNLSIIDVQFGKLYTTVETLT